VKVLRRRSEWEDNSGKKERRKLFISITLQIVMVLGGGGFAFQTISINQAKPIMLGASTAVAAACDPEVTVTPKVTLSPTTNQMMVSQIQLSDVDQSFPGGCGGSIMEMQVLVDGKATIATWAISTSSINNTYTWGDATGGVNEASNKLSGIMVTSFSAVALQSRRPTCQVVDLNCLTSSTSNP
jgi:hypothetical protein